MADGDPGEFSTRYTSAKNGQMSSCERIGKGNPLRSVLLVIGLDGETSSTWEVVDCFRDCGSRNDLHATTQLLTRYGALRTQCTAY